MSPRLTEFQLVLADTSLFCRFEENLKSPGLKKLVSFFGESLQIVTEVDRELRGLAHHEFPGVAVLKLMREQGQFLMNKPARMTPAMAQEMIDVAPSWDSADPAKPKKNYGEIATVLVALERSVPIIMDDRDGRDYARDKGAGPVFRTRDVVATMLADGALTEAEALLVWNACSYRHHGSEQLRAAASRTR